MKKPTLIYDTECYRDYWLLKFRNVATGNTRGFELYPGSDPLDVETIKAILRQSRVVSFNGRNYDMPMIAIALGGASTATLKKASDAIIVTGLKPWHIESQFNVTIPTNTDHIDLIEVAPGVASLKIYGGRIHAERMQDLPIEPGASISPADRALLYSYCGNDLITTQGLFEYLAPQIALRERMSIDYDQDLRSKSDAQIAEAVIKAGVSKILGTAIPKPSVEAGTTFRYRKPDYIAYQTPVLKDVLAMVMESEFVVADSGKMLLPKGLTDAKIKIGSSVYRMGIGGLHSSEKSVAHVTDGTFILVDRDVASYYPAIILQLGLFPKHMGKAFLKVYGDIVRRRLDAKASGDKVTADSLKITINGSFGKFGSKWSILYSPDLLIQTTITGQLALLMFIEMMEGAGISVVSANTDGVVMRCPVALQGALADVVARWEKLTGFDTEETKYAALYSRDVNNYVAVKTNGSYKLKGAYAPPGLQKNPSNEICAEAVVKFLIDGVPVADTINNCTDVRKFLSIRTVGGGAVKGDEYLGKAIRWYYSFAANGEINYKVNGNKVPMSDSAQPFMELGDTFPADLDHGWYINEAQDILKDIGYSALL